MGPHQLALLAALMRHYQQRVYEPKLEVDETGAQLPSPSLPNITARRLYDQWIKRAQALNPALAPRAHRHRDWPAWRSGASWCPIRPATPITGKSSGRSTSG